VLQSNMKTLKICLVILCLLHVRAVGLPRFSGATFFMEEIIEVWKPVKGYEDHYEVSNLGNVRSKERTINHSYWGKVKIKPKVRKQQLNKKGYLVLLLQNAGYRFGTGVHRLVAIAFVPNPENKPQVNHKNGIKTDNRAQNLEWATNRENVIHSYANGLQVCPTGVNHHNSIPVIQLSKDGLFISEYVSAVEASLKTGIQRMGISLAARGRLKTSGGFIWKFKTILS
jgi:hypothetical protein